MARKGARTQSRIVAAESANLQQKTDTKQIQPYAWFSLQTRRNPAKTAGVG